MSNNQIQVDQRLAVFRDCLPDSNLELARQWPSVEFPLFNRLPLELRRKIWDFSGGRKIPVYMHHYGVLRTIRAPPPDLFLVCKEAYMEELTHYKTPCPKKDYCSNHDNQQPALHLYYFDARVDTVFISKFDELRHWAYLRVREGPRPPFIGECLDNIRVLEIGRQDWNSAAIYPWDRFTREKSGTLTDIMGEVAWINTFRLFKGLDELIVRGGGGFLSTQVHARECRQGLTELYEELREEFPESKVPKVTIAFACHKSGAECCEKCFVGLTFEEIALLSKFKV